MSTVNFIIARGASGVDSASLLYHTNLVLLSIVGLFIIARLPRAIALFGTTSEWFDGHFLRNVESRVPHAQRPTEKGAQATIRYPPHVDSSTEFLRPLLKPLRFRISPGFSIAQSLIFLVYFICLAYASLYKSNIFTDGSRTGWVAAAQLPLIFVLAQKNNVLGFLLGCGYEHVIISQPLTQRKIILKY